jgi:hypothetical protein
MSATTQILEFLDTPKSPLGQSRYGIEDVLGNMRAKDMSLDQLQHYTANRGACERYKDEETVFEEFTRLAKQADEETTDQFARISNSRFDRATTEKLGAEVPVPGPDRQRVTRIAYGMLRDGWGEGHVRHALGTLGAA